jgi:peptidoglycan L-alanyl-D-glutamate endopeptidase CwlK
MDDIISKNRILTLHPEIRDIVTYIFTQSKRNNIYFRITQALRSFEEQELLYSIGRYGDTRKIVTNARGGHSWHNYGLAFDFALMDKDYKNINWDMDSDHNENNFSDWIVNLAKKEGFSWGGDWKFKDYPHLEITFNLKIKDALNKYNAGDTDASGYINL